MTETAGCAWLEAQRNRHDLDLKMSRSDRPGSRKTLAFSAAVLSNAATRTLSSGEWGKVTL